MLKTAGTADAHLIILNLSVPLLQKDYFSPSHQFISPPGVIGNVECDNYLEYSVEKVHCVLESRDRDERQEERRNLKCKE